VFPFFPHKEWPVEYCPPIAVPSELHLEQFLKTDSIISIYHLYLITQVRVIDQAPTELWRIHSQIEIPEISLPIHNLTGLMKPSVTYSKIWMATFREQYMLANMYGSLVNLKMK
jgi:hypothetical protein